MIRSRGQQRWRKRWSRRERRRAAVGSACVALFLSATTGCSLTPSTSSDAQWHQSAIQAIDDVASQLATALIVLDQEDHRRFLGPTAEVMLSQATSAASSVAATFAALQPPAHLVQRHLSLVATLDRGVQDLTRARIAVTAGQRGSYDDLRLVLQTDDNSLTATSDALEDGTGQ